MSLETRVKTMLLALGVSAAAPTTASTETPSQDPNMSKNQITVTADNPNQLQVTPVEETPAYGTIRDRKSKNYIIFSQNDDNSCNCMLEEDANKLINSGTIPKNYYVVNENFESQKYKVEDADNEVVYAFNLLVDDIKAAYPPKPQKKLRDELYDMAETIHAGNVAANEAIGLAYSVQHIVDGLTPNRQKHPNYSYGSKKRPQIYIGGGANNRVYRGERGYGPNDRVYRGEGR